MPEKKRSISFNVNKFGPIRGFGEKRPASCECIKENAGTKTNIGHTALLHYWEQNGITNLMIV